MGLRVGWHERVLDGLVAAGILIIFVLLVLQVCFRYFFSYSLSWSEEAATFLMMWTGMLGVVSLMRDGQFIAFDLISNSTHPALRVICRGVSVLGILSLAVLLVVIGMKMSIFSISTSRAAASDIPIRWVYLVFPITGITLCLRLGLSLWKSSRARTIGRDPDV